MGEWGRKEEMKAKWRREREIRRKEGLRGAERGE